MSKTEDLRRSILAIADPDKVSPFNGDMVTLFMHEVEKLIDSAIEEERGACARVCESRIMGDNNREDQEAKRCASAIRARGTP